MVQSNISGEPPVDTWLSILATCPNLTVLRLCSSSTWSFEEEGDTNGRANVPAIVELPVCEIWSLTIFPPITSESFSNDSAFQKSPPAPSEVFSTCKVTITNTPFQFHLVVVRPGWRIKLVDPFLAPGSL
ncbi:hypothetical protein M407DRAFT_18151 [Tulasnella calospora MUT 4182]|uniref:Uncharacterized protein n=1 Tax=Tulasnella calospora MUT 4182 TaxID=1051891 RepID=A0A0C3QKF5_9AGAM|nr:hypothetical protein M407DRAFT_18151 [Tulasnella calospora MUT 4182]